MVSVNTNDTMTCIVGENIRQKVQSLTRVCVWGGGGRGVVNYKEPPCKNVQYLTGLRESSYPLNHKLNNCKNK